MPEATGWLHAVFASPADARHALERLAEAGVSATDVEVRSSVPLHGVVPAGQRLRTRVPLMAVLGGLVGGIGAYLLVSVTSRAYPLPTGGMPIVAMPTTGVIAFEGIAIGAILFTVATVLVECGLPGFGQRMGPLDAHISVGRIVVSVTGGAAESREWARGALVTQDEPGST